MKPTPSKAHTNRCVRHASAESGSVSELCRVRGQLRSLSGSRYRQVSDEANVNYWVNDWLLLAPSSTVDTFSQIYERLPLYRAVLKEVGIHTEWMHFVWAIHIHHAIRVASGTTAIAGMSGGRLYDCEACRVRTRVQYECERRQPAAVAQDKELGGPRRAAVPNAGYRRPQVQVAPLLGRYARSVKLMQVEAPAEASSAASNRSGAGLESAARICENIVFIERRL